MFATANTSGGYAKGWLDCGTFLRVQVSRRQIKESSFNNNNNNNNNNDLITAYLQGSSTSANLINITILLKYLLIIFRVGNVR